MTVYDMAFWGHSHLIDSSHIGDPDHNMYWKCIQATKPALVENRSDIGSLTLVAAS